MSDMHIVRRGTPPPPPPPPWGDDTPYYWEGEEFVDVTGGWIPGNSVATSSQSKESNHFFLSAVGTLSYSTYVTANKIDASDLQTIYIDVDIYDITDNRFEFGFFDNADGAANPISRLTRNSTTSGREILSLDVSSVTGSYYLSCLVRGAKARVYRMWGEE